MSGPTRRSILKAGAAALSGLASSATATNTQQNAQTETSVLETLIDPDELHDRNAIYRELSTEEPSPRTFLVTHPSKFHEDASQHVINEFIPTEKEIISDNDINMDFGLIQEDGEEIDEFNIDVEPGFDIDHEFGFDIKYDILNIDSENILGRTDEAGGIQVVSYDLYDTVDDDRISSRLEDRGFEGADISNIETDTWDLYRAEGVEDKYGEANILAAVNGKTVIYAPEYDDPESREEILTDAEEGLKVAIDTFAGELENHSEGDGLESQILSIMTEFEKDNDLGPLEDPHIYYGAISHRKALEVSEEDPVGFLQLYKADGNDVYSQQFLVNRKPEIINTNVDPEVETYPDTGSLAGGLMGQHGPFSLLANPEPMVDEGVLDGSERHPVEIQYLQKVQAEFPDLTGHLDPDQFPDDDQNTEVIPYLPGDIRQEDVRVRVRGEMGLSTVIYDEGVNQSDIMDGLSEYLKPAEEDIGSEDWDLYHGEMDLDDNTFIQEDIDYVQGEVLSAVQNNYAVFAHKPANRDEGSINDLKRAVEMQLETLEGERGSYPEASPRVEEVASYVEQEGFRGENGPQLLYADFRDNSEDSGNFKLIEYAGDVKMPKEFYVENVNGEPQVGGRNTQNN